MKAKEYLISIGELDRSINTKQKVLVGLERDKERLSAITYDSIRVQSSVHSDPTEIIDKIDKLQREINFDIDRLVDLKAEAKKKISRVYNQRFINLLTDVYINGMTIERFAELWSKKQNREMSVRTVQRWHGQALQIFRKENHML